MARDVSIFEARRVLNRMEMEKEHLYGVLNLIQKDMGASLDYTYGTVPAPVVDEEKAPDVVVAEGGEATINVGGEGTRQFLSPEEIEAYRARMEPIKQEIEDLCNKIVAVEMALERAELDTQVTIDV